MKKSLHLLWWSTVRAWPMFFVGITLAKYNLSIGHWLFWLVTVASVWMLEQGYKAQQKQYDLINNTEKQ